MSNEDKASELTAVLLDIYTTRLEGMKLDGEKTNVSLLKEVREFLKQHNIELDPNSAPMQNLAGAHDDLTNFRARRAAHASIAGGGDPTS